MGALELAICGLAALDVARGAIVRCSAAPAHDRPLRNSSNNLRNIVKANLRTLLHLDPL